MHITVSSTETSKNACVITSFFLTLCLVTDNTKLDIEYAVKKSWILNEQQYEAYMLQTEMHVCRQSE